ncbi:MAG: hypothetical protein AVDCRST_MAG64-1055, partial [uncultured Phycisphaerae bacterium]
ERARPVTGTAGSGAGAPRRGTLSRTAGVAPAHRTSGAAASI